MTGADVFEACRPRLTAVAYGMLGDRGEAEDAVQDAWLRFAAAGTDAVRNAEAFLVTVTTRLAIDRLRSARARRETYVGPWLPEPIVRDAADDDPADIVAEAEQLSLALLVALERLDPVERAVLLLRDVFDLEYEQIADAVAKTPANCRQLASRARTHVGEPARRRTVDPEEEARVVGAFIAAATGGDVDALIAVLAADANTYSDGGGVVTAARKPSTAPPRARASSSASSASSTTRRSTCSCASTATRASARSAPTASRRCSRSRSPTAGSPTCASSTTRRSSPGSAEPGSRLSCGNSIAGQLSSTFIFCRPGRWCPAALR